MEGNIKKKEKGQSGRNERRLSRKMSEKGIWEKLSQNCTEKNTQRSGKSERGKQKQDPKKWIGESDKTRKEKGKGKKNRRRKDESEKKKNRR